MKDAFSADRSIAFLSRDTARSESSMIAWTLIALLLVVALLTLGCR